MILFLLSVKRMHWYGGLLTPPWTVGAASSTTAAAAKIRKNEDGDERTHAARHARTMMQRGIWLKAKSTERRPPSMSVSTLG